MHEKELQVKIRRVNEDTIKIFSQKPKFVTWISGNPESVRYHQTFYNKLSEILSER